MKNDGASRNSPEPPPGFRRSDFRKVSENGFGDRYNAYAYSMAWFADHLFVGTSRANLHLLKIAMPFVRIDTWPVECLHDNYTPEFEQEATRGEIWKLHPPSGQWTRAFQAPLVRDAEGVEFSRDLGYRGMEVYQSPRDSAPALYAATWSRSLGTGPDILCTRDGVHFDVLPKPRFGTGDRAITFNAIRSLTAFRGRLYTAPTGATKGNVNASGVSRVYATDDPASGEWECVNDPGFGEPPDVLTVYELAVAGGHLYAATMGLSGFQVWRTDGEGTPLRWEKVVDRGAGRGALNQIGGSMVEFRGALYMGTGIQNGGHDWRNKIGPAAAEVLRINADGSVDIIVGNPRDGQEPLSGMRAGFGNFFAGYLWRMGVCGDWLYAGTMDWATILEFSDLTGKPSVAAKMIADAGVANFVRVRGGFELWRTADGENWLPVTRDGFGNRFNYGCRTITATPHGLFVGTANPFGPRVAVQDRKSGEWRYEDNPAGGLEIWCAGSPNQI